MKRTNYVAVGIVAGLVILLLVLVNSRHIKEQFEADSGFRPVMGTFARVVAVAQNSNAAKRCIQAAFSELELVDNMMSDYKDDSQLSKINRQAYKQQVKVSEPLFYVLEKSMEFSRQSDGAFDITVGPLVDLYRSAEEKAAAPTSGQITAAKQKTGYEKLKLNAENRTVRFAVDGMRLDLGGIAKGYAIDKAIEAMKDAGAAGGMVDVGGDVRCFGRPTDKPYWLIGVQDPAKAGPNDIGTGKTLFILKVNDAAVATSGNYRRFVEIQGEKYSHIIDAEAGKGSESVSSVTIICQSAIDADALATAVSVMGVKKGLVFIEKRQNTEAIVISPAPEYKVNKTSGTAKYIHK